MADLSYNGQNELDLQQLVNGWMKQERNGEQFPVPLHEVWSIAGHTRKEKAFSLAESVLREGFEFCTSQCKTSSPQGGRPTKAMFLTCDALKHFCMAAQTEQGQMVRQYFIEAEKALQQVKSLSEPVPVSDRCKAARAFRRPSARQICSVQELVFGKVIDPIAMAFLKAKAVADVYPEVEGALALGIASLPEAEPEEQTFTPTQLGSEMEPPISGKRFNELLEEFGLQSRRPRAKGGFDWVPTEKAEGLCTVTFVSKADGAPKESIRWKQSVLSMLVNS